MQLEYLYGDNNINQPDNGISSRGGNDKIYGGSNGITSVLIGGIMDDYIVSGDNNSGLQLIFGDYPAVNNLQLAPTSRWASVGGLLNGKPLICGGFNGTHSFQDCFFVQGNINQNISMTQIRSFATAVVLRGKA